jgi:uncharacterized oxidoreductase
MKVSGNTVLITGGATGIGLALAAVLVDKGNDVIVCGRRRDKLKAARVKIPGLHTRVCDISKATSRQFLVRWATSSFKALNILINNAGIQRAINFRKGLRDIDSVDEEIATNLRAPIHLTALLVPHFMKKKQAAVVNISSGLAFTPLATVPVYCATKAAIHSLSLSLRHQLKGTSIKVFEVAPPIVDTELAGPQRSRRDREDMAISPDAVAVAFLKALKKDSYEVAIGLAQDLRRGRDRLFENINH